MPPASLTGLSPPYGAGENEPRASTASSSLTTVRLFFFFFGKHYGFIKYISHCGLLMGLWDFILSRRGCSFSGLPEALEAHSVRLVFVLPGGVGETEVSYRLLIISVALCRSLDYTLYCLMIITETLLWPVHLVISLILLIHHHLFSIYFCYRFNIHVHDHTWILTKHRCLPLCLAYCSVLHYVASYLMCSSGIPWYKPLLSVLACIHIFLTCLIRAELFFLLQILDPFPTDSRKKHTFRCVFSTSRLVNRRNVSGLLFPSVSRLHF